MFHIITRLIYDQQLTINYRDSFRPISILLSLAPIHVFIDTYIHSVLQQLAEHNLTLFHHSFHHPSLTHQLYHFNYRRHMFAFVSVHTSIVVIPPRETCVVLVYVLLLLCVGHELII
jgi:hypothetical protein